MIFDIDEFIRRGISPDRVRIDLGRAPILSTAAVASAVLFVFLLAWQDFVPFEYLSRDPLVVAKETNEFKRFFGLISNIGILLWCSATALCLFAAAEVRIKNKSREASNFFVTAAVFTAVLTLDDLFQLHEVLESGQKALYVFYGMVMIIYIVYFHRILVALGPSLWLVSCGCLGISVVVDSFGFYSYLGHEYHFLVEDGSKFVGITAWTAFQIRAVWFRDALCRMLACPL